MKGAVGEPRRASWIAYLSVVLLVVATCGSTSDGAALRGSPSETPPPPPVVIDLPQNPIVAGASVGYLPGSPEVSPTGEMTYRLPLDVPAGVAGMEPHLALSYSSRAGSGPIGRGWSLEGSSSSVTRGPKTLAVQGTRDGVDFDGSDTYCLDGQQLVSVGQNEFRTENDAMARIVMAGPAAAPPGFTVSSKNGRIRTYEALAPAQRVSATAQATTLATSVVLDWPLKDEADRSGNVIHYVYTHNQNPVAPYDEEIRLDHIDYTDGPGGASARRSVQLEYEARADKSFAYHHGIRYQLRTRLKGIKMWAPNPTVKSLVWEYRLGYLDGASSQLRRSLLQSVQKCGYLGTCTFAKHFGWSVDGYPALYETAPRPLASPSTLAGMITFDANGDGKDDVLYEVRPPGTGTFPDDVFHLMLSQAGPGLAPYQDVVVGGTVGGVPVGSPIDGMTLSASRPVDIDGDGRVELLARFEAPLVDNGDGPPVPANPNDTRATYLPVQLTDFDKKFHIFSPSFKAHQVDLVDANGDSRLDVVSFTKPDLYDVRLSGGATFQVQGTVAVPVTTCSVWPSGGDLDADGRGELLIPTANDCSTSATIGLDDAGAVVAEPGLPVKRGDRELQLADLNGDGLVDAMWIGDVVEASFNTGNGFGPPQAIHDPGIDAILAEPQDVNRRSVMVMDVDRDGRDDLLFTIRDHLTVDANWMEHSSDDVIAFLSNGDGSFTQYNLVGVDPGLGLRTADFDGDGTRDLFAVMPNGDLNLYLQQGKDDDDLLVAVSEDDAVATSRLSVEYARTNPADWAGATCAYPTLCIRHGSEVVQMVAGLDVGTPMFYHFEDPRADLLGRGFLGYTTMRVWEPERPLERTTTFDNATCVGTIYPNAQRPQRVRTVIPVVAHGPTGVIDKVKSENARVSETTFEYELRAPQGGPSHFVFARATHEQEWEENVAIDWTFGAPVHITAVDGPGGAGAPRQHNATVRVDDYANLLSNDEATVGGVSHHLARTYDYRPADWLIALVQTQEESTYEAAQTADTLHLLNHYDPVGRLDLSTVEPNGDPDVNVARALVYDTQGRLTQETRTTAGQPSRVRHFAYNDPSGEGVFLSQQWDEVDSTIVLSKWMYALPAFGGTMGIIDANGGVATTIHDDLGRPVEVTGAGKQPTFISYSPWHDTITAGIEVQVDDAGGSLVADSDARGLEVERRRLGFGGLVSVTASGYDTFGRILWQTRPDWGAASLSRAERSYDSLDRVTSSTAPDGATTTQSYTFFARTARDPQLRLRTVVQDADGRVVQATDMHDGQPLTTTYSYVHGSQPEWVTDPQNNKVHSSFDVRGRRTALEDPDAGLRRTRYDGFGDVVRTSDAANNTTDYILDRIGRVTGIVSTVDGTTTLSWDTQPHGLGQLAKTESPDGTVVESFYDGIGRPNRTDWTVPGPSVSMFSVERTYDADGRLDELRYPYAPNRPRMVVHPDYGDGSGGISTISAMGADGQMFDAWTVDGRNADGTLLDGRYGSKIDTHRSYDPVSGRLQSIVTVASTKSLVDSEYDYYNDGRLFQHRDLVANRVEGYEYDDLRRLSQWWLGANLQANYKYDDLGNLTGVDDKSGAHAEVNGYTAAGPHQLNERDGVVFHYDARGRLDSSTAGLNIAYTDFDLPRSFTKDGMTTQFDYDAGNHRVRKVNESGTTIYIGGIYERREDANGTKHVFNISGPDGMIAQVVYDEKYATDEIEYLHQDPQGSVTVATDPGGKEIDRLFYEPFGKRITAVGAPAGAPASDVLTGYTGQRHDDDLGLIDMRGRTYDPILRRFLQPDPVVTDAYEGQTYNRYSYVRNDPTNRIDPTGMRDKEKPWGDDGTQGGSAGYGDDGTVSTSGLDDLGKGWYGSMLNGGIVVGPEVVVVGSSGGAHDQNGDGAAVQAAAALADPAYQGSSTNQGINNGGGGGSGSGPGTNNACPGCLPRTFSDYFQVYHMYAVKGLLAGSAGALLAAGAVAALPAMAVGGLSTAATAAGEAVTAAVAPAATAASTVAAAAGTPTGQEVIEEAEEVAAVVEPVARIPSRILDDVFGKKLPGSALERATTVMESIKDGTFEPPADLTVEHLDYYAQRATNMINTDRDEYGVNAARLLIVNALRDVMK